MITGSLVALVTPMDPDGSVNFESLRHLIDWHIEQGTDGIVAVGTTGESATLDEKEHCEVLAKAVEYTAGRVPLIAGTGANSTSEAIALTRCAKSAGADACLLVTPYYNKPTQEGLYRHHAAIAKAVDIAQLLYNVPGRTACDLSVETTERLSKLENIVGIKDATGDLDRYRALRAACGSDFTILSGDDATGCEFNLAGGNGVISVTANIAPKAMAKMVRAAMENDRAQAEAIDKPLAGLHQHLFAESSPIPVKWALAEMGLIPPGIRLPLTWFAEEYHALLRTAMQEAGALTG